MLALVKEVSAPVDSYDQKLEDLFGQARIYRGNAAFGEGDNLSVTFTMDAKLWKQYQKSGWLGSLYGIDLGNYLSRKGLLKQYIVPSVDDKSRASKGIKTIRVNYYARSRY